MEICKKQIVDQLLRRGWYSASSVQYHPHSEERVVHRAMGAPQMLRTFSSGEEGTHEDNQSKGTQTVKRSA